MGEGDVITVHNASHVPPGAATIEQDGRNQAAVATPASFGTAARAVSKLWAISTAAPGHR